MKIGKKIEKFIIKKLQKEELNPQQSGNMKKNAIMLVIAIFVLSVVSLLGGIKLIIMGSTLLGVILTIVGLVFFGAIMFLLSLLRNAFMN